MRALVLAVKRAKRVYLCGNGGSAANAIHIANDLVSCGIKAHALTADVATLTAIANDFGYEYVFSRQISIYAEQGDLLIVLSGSGNSPNVLRALEMATQIGIESWAIVGGEGGEAAWCATHSIKSGGDMQQAENDQLSLGHELMKALV